MAKPSLVHTWATSGAIVTPTVPKRATGWVINEPLPAQWLNWWMNGVGQWLVYVNGITGEALTWTVSQAFSAGLTATTGAFTGALTGTTAAFSGAVSAASYGAVVGTTGTFSGLVTASAGIESVGTTRVDDVTYRAAKSLPSFVDASDFGMDANGRLSPNIAGNYVITNGTSAMFSARFRIPGGASLTDVGLLIANFAGVSQAVTGVAVVLVTDPLSGTNAPTRTNVQSTAYPPGPIINVTASSPATYYGIALPGGVLTVPGNGWVEVHFSLPSTTTLAIYVARAMYSVTVLRPS